MSFDFAPLLFLLALPAHSSAPVDTRAGFVTTLGRDTVAIESYTRTSSRLEGDVLVRVPGTVLCHYVLELTSDGSVARSTLDIKPMGTSEVAARRVTLAFGRDSVGIVVDSAGHRQRSRKALGEGAFPLLMTGFGSSYGLYSSLAVYELLLPRVLAAAGDTDKLSAVQIEDGRIKKRQFVRRSPTLVDADFFGIAWTHLSLDANAHILSADARETTERTRSQRTDFIDVGQTAKSWASGDRAGKGLGLASPPQIARATLGGRFIVLSYSSPRMRNREILGKVVPYGEVWRTGANEATSLICDHDLTIGGAAVPAGAYTLWTLPKQDGTVDLIINGQHGQWGTEYDQKRDLVRVPMRVSTVTTQQENFAIAIDGSGSAGELRISWDGFLWTATVTVK